MLRLTDLDPESTSEALDAIERSAVAQSELIEDVLDVSRITTGKLSLALEPVTVQDVVTAAVETLRPSAAAREVQVTLHCVPEPLRVMADPGRLQQVVWNLLSNAIKFTPRGGRVTIHCQAEGPAATLRVSDTGRGIRADLLPAIFDPFRQEDSSTTRASSGLGLGLAIVKRLVEMHGGTIHAESPGPQRGSVFTVTLPLKGERLQPQEEVDERRDASDAPARRVLPDLSRVDVLIVDDNADSRRFLSALMTRCGATVRTAEGVDDALREIRERRPGVLLSDIAMPERDGYSLMRELGGSSASIPSIALTAFGRGSDREQATAAGFSRYFKKPVDPAELAQAVAELGGVA